MKNKEKICSIALASTFMILSLILISFTASASPEQITATESIQVAVPTITETQITTNKSEQYDPAIYGSRIVWTEERNGEGGEVSTDIYMYNLSTSKETQITNSGNAFSSIIYGNNIVWEDWSDSEYGSMYMLDLFTKKQTLITTFSDALDSSAIYGDKIVFTTWGALLMYDLSTKTVTEIPINVDASYSDIYGNRTVYCPGWEVGSPDIYMYDLSDSTEKRITSSGSVIKPAIYKDRIVWEDGRNGNSDIYMYNLSTSKETQITTNTSNSCSPAIYGDRIVWEDDRNGNWDIYVYDLATGQESHTTNKSDQYSPDIYGNRIVWSDERNGNADIYMGTLSTTSPVAAFSAKPTSGTAPLNVSFTDNSTGTPTAWKWNFGDGTNSTLQNPKHTYSKAGNYTVKLTASNSAGNNTTTKANYIKVKAITKPVANFTSNVTSGYAPLNVSFTDKSTGSPTKWKWTFGDGTNSTLQNPKHTYSKAGNYTIKLTASNSAGNNTTTKTNYIKVKAVTKPIANFTSNVTSGYAPLNVSFTDKSTGSPTKWKWTFGDGTNSTVKNPTHKYSKAGNYTVALTASNSAGNNTTTKPNYIKVTTNTRPGSYSSK